MFTAPISSTRRGLWFFLGRIPSFVSTANTHLHVRCLAVVNTEASWYAWRPPRESSCRSSRCLSARERAEGVPSRESPATTSSSRCIRWNSDVT